MDESSEFGNGVTARITSMEATTATATLPGETSGPAVRITVEVSNGSAEPIDLGNVTVDLTNAAGLSSTQISSEPDTSFRGTADPGASTSGTYLFRLSPDERADVDVRVKYSSDTPIVIFAGSVPNA